MPNISSASSDRLGSKQPEQQAPTSPSFAPPRRPPSRGGWGRLRVPGALGVSRSRTSSGSSSEVSSSVDDPSKNPSLVGGTSVAANKLTGVGDSSGWAGQEDDRDDGRHTYALNSFVQANKPRPYWEVASEVVAKGSTMPKKRLVPLLRELCIRVGNPSVCDGAFFGALLAIVRSAKEGDWDGKAVRLVHFFVRGMVAAQGDTEGRVLGCHWEGRGITAAQLLQAVECFREESEHRATVRQIPAFQTLATLCQKASESGVSGPLSPVAVLKEATISPLRSLQAQEKPERGAKGKGRVHRQRIEAFQESLLLSASVLSAIRRCPALARDRTILPEVLRGCCSENALAARHAFGILAQQARQSPDEVSRTLLSKAMLVPTTVGMLQAPEDMASVGEEPNLSDSLACTYYLRAIKALAFTEALDHTMRLDMYRTMVSSVSDARHRVALEAMQCLLDHPRAWELLVNAQRESRDADIFRRVVDRIQVCVEEATAPGSARAGTGSVTDSDAAAGAAAATATPPLAGAVGGAAGPDRTRAGSTKDSTRPLSSAGVANVAGSRDSRGKIRKTKKGKGDDGGAVSRTDAGDPQCNWALAHAACRVCRVVGRTFQVAISYQTMQSLSRENGHDETSGVANFGATAGASSSRAHRRPATGQLSPSVKTAQGLGDTSGRARDGAPSTPGSGGGTAFNLLGLPPSPAPQSTTAGLSTWGASGGGDGGGAGGGGSLGGADIMAGQMVEQQNTAAIRGLCRTLQQHRLLESPHLHVRSLALEAMFLLVPDPSPLDPQLRGLWDWLQQRVEQCPSTLPASVLSELVDTVLTRVQCSAASREEVIPIALALTESFMYQVPSEEMTRCVLRAWCQCVGYGGRAREAVLQSVYRILDRNFSLPPEASRDTITTGSRVSSTFTSHYGKQPKHHTRGVASEDWTGQPAKFMATGLGHQKLQLGSEEMGAENEETPPTGAGESSVRSGSGGGNANGDGSGNGGIFYGDSIGLGVDEETPYWGKAEGGLDGSKVSTRGTYLRERASATRLKRSAFWFLGEYCCQLTATANQEDGDDPRKEEPVSSPNTSSTASDLMNVWASERSGKSGNGPGTERAPGAGSSGDEASSTPVPHSVVAAMNGATMSILLRLKHAAMFEDFQTRHSCVSALCKIALRFPDPVRFDVYCFLKDVAAAGSIFPLADSRCAAGDCAMSDASPGNSDKEAPLHVYLRQQEQVLDRMAAADAYGLEEVTAPVLQHLDGVFASSRNGVAAQAEAAGGACEPLGGEGSSAEIYRHLLDGGPLGLVPDL